MVGYSDGSLDKSVLCFLQQGGRTICSFCVENPKINHGEPSTFKVLVPPNTPASSTTMWSPKNRPTWQLQSEEIERGLEAGRGEWVPTGWWRSQSQGIWQRLGGSWWVWYEEGAFQSSSQADRWLQLLLSAPRQCSGPEQQDAPWLACLINGGVT